MTALNSIYFSIGFAIILALAAALFGPLLVDWTAYRSQFEAQASAILGHPVRVAGTADATLLPYPSLTFTEVVIGGDPAHPVMTVGRFDLEVELFPLLSGKIQISNMELQNPVATLRVDTDGRFEWLASSSDAPIDPNAVSLDRVTIAGGRLTVLDARRPAPLEIADVGATLEARSLLGPFKIDGLANVAGEPVAVRISTGTADGAGRMVAKISIEPSSRPVSIALDGQFDTAGDRLTFIGRTELRRMVPQGAPADVLPWSLTASSEFDASQLLLKQLEFRYGPEDRPFSISGAATIGLGGAPAFTAVLSARQIDLDRTLGQGPDQPVAFQAVLAALSEAILTLPKPPIPGHIGFDIPGIVVGGAMMTGVTLDLSTARDGWRLETLEAQLPGDTRLGATGDITTRPRPAFSGTLALASDQPATLVSWWRPDLPRTRLQPFDARGRMALSDAGLTLSEIDVAVGEARVGGEASYLPAASGQAPRLTLRLGATELDLEQAEAVAALFGGGEAAGSRADVILQLEAGTLIAGESRAEGVDLSASLVEGTLSVDRFAVRSLAGARISAAGTIRDIDTAPDGSFQGRISAERLDGLAAAVRAVAPRARIGDLIGTAAPVLVPASVEVTVTAKAADGSTDARLVVDGTAGGSRISGGLGFKGRVDAWRRAATELTLAVEGPNGLVLMRQLGIDVPEVPGAGAGALQIEMSGVPGDRLAGRAEARLGATAFTLAGHGRMPEAGPVEAALDASLKSPDAGPILALSGSLLADLMASTPVDLTAAIALEGPRATLSGLAGSVDGEPVSGELALDFAGELPKASGRLALESASLEGLGELALGSGSLAPSVIDSAGPWPEAPFGPAPLDAVEVDLAVTLDRLSLTEELFATGVSFALRSSAAGIGYDAIAADLAGGRLTGHLLVKQDLEGTAAISGTLALADAEASEFSWRRNDLPVVTGRLGLDVEGTATGRTVAGLMSTLSGGGAFRIVDGAIRSFNPQAFTAVIRAADGGQELSDARIAEIFTDTVDAGDLPFERVEGTFTLAAGVLRAPNIAVTGGDGETVGSASLDFGRDTLESDWRLAFDPRDQAADGAPPQVGILFRGDLAEPSRSVDVTAFSSWLGIRSFERETERVLRMQADILERELLSRQVLLGREAEARAARAAAEEAERRRLAEEEAAAAAEAARAASEAGPPVQAPDAPIPPPPLGPAPSDRGQPAPDAPIPPPPAAPADGDAFAEEILRRLQENQPLRPGEPLPGLPGVEIGPSPRGG